MAKKLKPKLDDKEQSQRFVETAQNLGTDESGKKFERALDDISKPKVDHSHQSEKTSSS